MRKSFVSLFTLAALTAAFCTSVTAHAHEKGKAHDAAKVGAPAPAFTLKDQTGKDVSLSDYAGKIVVLEWFNEGCPFVVKHYKQGHMNTLAAKYAEKGVVWLAINSTKSATVESNSKITGEWKINHPILDDAAGTIGKAYAAKTTPHMYVIDAKGVLAYAGAIDSKSSTDSDDIAGSTNYVGKAVDELLAGSNVTESQTKPYGCSVKYAK